MQQFYCDICKATETVNPSTSMIYHRHNNALVILTAIPERLEWKQETIVSKRSLPRRRRTEVIHDEEKRI